MQLVCAHPQRSLDDTAGEVDRAGMSRSQSPTRGGRCSVQAPQRGFSSFQKITNFISWVILASGMGNIMKGKEKSRREANDGRNDGFTQMRLTICFRVCTASIDSLIRQLSISLRLQIAQMYFDNPADNKSEPIYAPRPICIPRTFPRRRARWHCSSSA